MNGRLIERVETGIEAAAALMLGVAVGYAAYATLNVAALSGGAGILVFVACFGVMRRLARRRAILPVPVFNVRDIEPEWDELVLADVDRVGCEELVLTDGDRIVQSGPEPLELDDILAELGPDSRVVRLFDPKSMPTPAELQVRIDTHLGRGAPGAPLSDASQALSEALAQLRRSLR